MTPVPHLAAIGVEKKGSPSRLGEPFRERRYSSFLPSVPPQICMPWRKDHRAKLFTGAGDGKEGPGVQMAEHLEGPLYQKHGKIISIPLAYLEDDVERKLQKVAEEGHLGFPSQ